MIRLQNLQIRTRASTEKDQRLAMLKACLANDDTLSFRVTAMSGWRS
ncbi:hypothetical protein [Arthrobacter sp. LAR12-1-1.1]